MGIKSTADIETAWQAMQTQGRTRKEVATLLGYGAKSSAAGVEALFEACGLLTWTDETGRLHAYKQVNEREEHAQT